MFISKVSDTPCNIIVNGTTLEQVSKYKSLVSWLAEDARCELQIKMRIFGRIKNY